MVIAKQDKILITGASGLLGTALTQELKRQGYENLYFLKREECDLTDFNAVKRLFADVRPDVVFHLAVAVFGIGGYAKNQGKIFLDNLLMNTHVVEASRLVGVKKIIAMGTVASYPAPKIEPVVESSIWDGPPFGAESSYAHAKRAMLAQLLAYQENYATDFAYVFSTNLYGPHDRFDSEVGNVIPSLIKRFYDAKQNHSEVVIWGDGSAVRDFLHCKDMARALVLIMNQFTGAINVASGQKTMIKEVAAILAEYLNMQEQVVWDASKPNGRKYFALDLSKLKALGFVPEYSIERGLIDTYEWYAHHLN